MQRPLLLSSPIQLSEQLHKNLWLDEESIQLVTSN